MKIFAGMLGDLSQGMALGTDLALRVAEIRSRAALLPSPDEINALEAAALAKRRETMTPTQIRGLAAEAIAHLHGVATYREMQAAAEAFYTGPWLDGVPRALRHGPPDQALRDRSGGLSSSVAVIPSSGRREVVSNVPGHPAEAHAGSVEVLSSANPHCCCQAGTSARRLT